MNWIKVTEALPTTEVPLGQARVLFCRPEWATPLMGMFTWRGPAESLPAGEALYEWAQYDAVADRYFIAATSDDDEQHRPTHWLLIPALPTPERR